MTMISGKIDKRIAICDDDPVDVEYNLKLISEWAAQRGIAIRPECFSSAESFLFRYEENNAFDIILLDIEMGAMDGVTLARKIRSANALVQIIFITGFSDYISEGYEVEALHYLMKPIAVDKLYKVLDRAVEKIKLGERCLDLECYGEINRIPFYEIRYIDVHQNYVTIHAERDYTVKRTLSDIEKELDEGFARAGRAMIINLRFIRRITKQEVILSDGSELPLPRGAYEALNRAIIANG